MTSPHLRAASAALAAGLVIVAMMRPSPVKLGTFNIRDYPRTDNQPRYAFDLIASLDLDALGVQEITNPEHFARNARGRLGSNWQVVFPAQDVRHRVGLIYDDDTFDLLSTHTHHETALTRGSGATFEVRLETEELFASRRLRIFVLHLKAGGDAFRMRREQLRRLRPVLDDALASGDEVIVLGDFNTTGEADRGELRVLTDATDLDWSTEELACTSYWDRGIECRTTALDHILATPTATSVEASGACTSIGCQINGSCPTYVELVSDHCPVVATF